MNSVELSLDGVDLDTQPTGITLEMLVDQIETNYFDYLMISLVQAMKHLETLRLRSERCGCAQCRATFEAAVYRYALEWGTPPAEDEKLMLENPIVVNKYK